MKGNLSSSKSGSQTLFALSKVHNLQVFFFDKMETAPFFSHFFETFVAWEVSEFRRSKTVRDAGVSPTKGWRGYQPYLLLSRVKRIRHTMPRQRTSSTKIHGVATSPPFLFFPVNARYFFCRWWFQTSFIFTPTWGNDPNWRLKPPTTVVFKDPAVRFPECKHFDSGSDWEDWNFIGRFQIKKSCSTGKETWKKLF